MKLSDLKLDVREGVVRFAEEIERQMRIIESDLNEHAFLPLLRYYKRAKRKFRDVQIERDQDIARHGEIEDKELTSLMEAAARVAAAGYLVANFYQAYREEGNNASK